MSALRCVSSGRGVCQAADRAALLLICSVIGFGSGSGWTVGEEGIWAVVS